MEDNEIPKSVLQPWSPVTEPLELKVLGKFVEELGECVTVTGRCIIQRITESEPTTGKPNQRWLEEEIADVLANCELVIEHFNLDGRRIEFRRWKKIENLRSWHKMPVKGG